MPNLIGWRGNVTTQVGNATRHGDKAVRWLDETLKAKSEDLTNSKEFPNIGRKLANCFIDLAKQVMRGTDKTHVSLARSLLQAQEVARQKGTLPKGRQLYQIILQYYRVDAEKHGGRFTYEDLSAITLKGDNIEKFLQDFDAGLLA